MTTKIDDAKLNQLLGRAINDIGAALQAPLMVLGDRLGLYKALEGAPLTTSELAKRTGTAERYVREWVRGQAAAGYVSYDAGTDRYWLSPEQALLFANEGSPAFMAGGFEVAVSAGRIEPRLAESFRTGTGIGWHEHDDGVFRGTARFFEPGYRLNLVPGWIPALNGIEEKLEAGARVADVGCGHGVSTLLMAQRFPRSRFQGFDYHADSIREARRRVADLGIENASFDVATAGDFPGTGYDLVTMLDCLHDLGDPVGAAEQVRHALAPDGTWMLVEPRASDRVEETLNPIGRIYYAGSTLLCTPNSLSQDVGLALGAQAGEAAIRAITEEAGFSRFRRAADTPFNLVFEVRP